MKLSKRKLAALKVAVKYVLRDAGDYEGDPAEALLKFGFSASTIQGAATYAAWLLDKGKEELEDACIGEYKEPDEMAYETEYRYVRNVRAFARIMDAVYGGAA